MRLIDADAIPALFDEKFKETRQLILQGEDHLDNLAEGFLEADRVTQGMPTIDAVPVVRCKDCANRRDDEDYARGHYCVKRPSNGGYFCEDNDFCSYGERKDGEGS